MFLSQDGTASVIASGAGDSMVGGSGQSVFRFAAIATDGVVFGGAGTVGIMDAGSHDTMAGAGRRDRRHAIRRRACSSPVRQCRRAGPGQGDTVIGGAAAMTVTSGGSGLMVSAGRER